MPLDFSQPHRLIDVGHSRLAYWSVGSGPDVLFIHGWPLTAATFRKSVESLSGEYTCHLFDLPGCGATVWDDHSLIDLGTHATTVRAFVDALGLRRYAVVAHDSGGYIARELAASDDRVSGLVLGNTEIPDYIPPPLVAFGIAGMLGLGRPLMQALLGSPWLRHSPLVFGNCFTDRGYIDGEFGQLFVQPLLGSPRAMAGQARLINTVKRSTMARLAGFHPRIRVPVALVWGPDDTWFPLARAKSMLGQFGGPVNLVEIPTGKLFAHEDHSGQFTVAARSHLARCT